MVNVMVVAPDPAAIEFGEKTAVAPGGKPLTEKLTAAGMVVAFSGVTVKVKDTGKPGITVAEVFDALILKSGVAPAFTVKLCATGAAAA